MNKHKDDDDDDDDDDDEVKQSLINPHKGTSTYIQAGDTHIPHTRPVENKLNRPEL